MSTALIFDKTVPGQFTLDSYKKYFADFLDWLKLASTSQPVASLVRARARFIDEVLQSLWQHFDLSQQKQLDVNCGWRLWPG